jgi:hypothetical protein
MVLMIEGPAFTSTVSLIKPTNFTFPIPVGSNSTTASFIPDLSDSAISPSTAFASTPPSGLSWFTVNGYPIFTSAEKPSTPATYDSNTKEQDEKDENEHDIDNLSHEAKTAFSVWDCSLVLSKLLESLQSRPPSELVHTPQLQINLKGQRIIELGAGRGIVGMASARLGAKAVITDVDDVVDALQEIVTMNELDTLFLGTGGGHVEKVVGLDWTNR